MASKIETGEFANSGSTSPIHLEGLENVFLGLHATKNLVDDVPFVYSPYRDYTSSAALLNNPSAVTSFQACQFAAPLSGRVRWVDGSFMKFDGCTFSRSAGQSSYTAIDLHTDSHVHNCDIQMVPGHSGVVTLRGTHSTVRDVTLRLNTNAAAGPQLRIASGAAHNVVENFKILGGGNPQSRVSSDLPDGRYGTNVIRLHPGYVQSTAAAGTIGDVRADVVALTSVGANIIWISPRHEGATIQVVNTASSGNARFITDGNVHGANYPDDIYLAPGQGASFVYVGGVWYQT
ncbi:hypothetical protein [Brachybacterium massiliense]|uniref:hypothetical protein n=1 Tax=Brachybacterium massiliense TaxID=1755098 RepID=UPI000B3BC2D3|nr:hypothetical protein [Brachybacterium massiliense]